VVPILKMAFPFSEINTEEFQEFKSQIYNIYEIQSFLNEESTCNRTMTSVLISFQQIKHKYNIIFKNKSFLDCMSFGAKASLYATHFGLSSTTSIEFSQAGFNQAKKSIAYFGDNPLISSIQLKLGRFQDYFQFDSDIIYFDSILLGPYLDEYHIFNSFFTCCKRLLPGSFLIILANENIVEVINIAFELIHCELIKMMSEESFYLFVLKKN